MNTLLVPTVRGRPFFVTPNKAAERIRKEKFNGLPKPCVSLVYHSFISMVGKKRIVAKS